jgi:hypothetical protein
MSCGEMMVRQSIACAEVPTTITLYVKDAEIPLKSKAALLKSGPRQWLKNSAFEMWDIQQKSLAYAPSAKSWVTLEEYQRAHVLHVARTS